MLLFYQPRYVLDQYFEPKVKISIAVKARFWLCDCICTQILCQHQCVSQMSHHWLTQFTCTGLHSWCEREARKKPKPSEIKKTLNNTTYLQKSLNPFLSNNWIHRTTCEDLFPEHPKNLLLTVLLTSISCFWMTISWLCDCKNTARKLFWRSLTHILVKDDCIITLILSTFLRLDLTGWTVAWPKPSWLGLTVPVAFMPYGSSGRHDTDDCLVEARSSSLNQN